MSESVQVALIGGLCVALPTIFVNWLSNRNNRVLMNYRLDQIEKKQDKYNNVINRTFKLEQDSSLYEEKIKVINHRIDDLENQG